MMSTVATSMKLEDAKRLADRIVHCLEHFCEKIEVAGSIRRKRPEVQDIDIVLIPHGWGRWAAITNWLKERMHGTIVEGGEELVRLRIEGTQVDLYRARPQTWGVLLLIRTGSKQHNIKLCSRARTMDLFLSAANGVMKEGNVIASKTEEDIFRALNLDFVPPEAREA